MERRPGQLSQAAPSARTRFLGAVDLPEVGQALGHATTSSSRQDFARLFRRDDGLRRRTRVRDAVVAAAVAGLVRPRTGAAHGVLSAVGSRVNVVVLFNDRHHEGHRLELQGKHRLPLSFGVQRKICLDVLGAKMPGNEDSVLESSNRVFLTLKSRLLPQQ